MRSVNLLMTMLALSVDDKSKPITTDYKIHNNDEPINYVKPVKSSFQAKQRKLSKKQRRQLNK